MTNACLIGVLFDVRVTLIGMHVVWLDVFFFDKRLVFIFSNLFMVENNLIKNAMVEEQYLREIF